jgi:hypothetical protein
MCVEYTTGNLAGAPNQSAPPPARGRHFLFRGTMADRTHAPTERYIRRLSEPARQQDDLTRAVSLFWIGILAVAHGEDRFAECARDGLITITKRQPHGFPEAIIDATAERFVATMPHISLAQARHTIGLDACRLVPEIQWLDLTLIDAGGNA